MDHCQAFYDQSFFGILHLNVAGMAVYANEAWTRISGMQPGDSRGYRWLESIHAGDRGRVLNEWREQTSTSNAGDISFRVVRPDGSRRYVQLRGRLLPPGMGEAGSYLAVVLDMTERVLAERRLQRNNELLSAVLANIPCGVTVFDHDGCLVLDNQKFRALLPSDNSPESAITDFGTPSIAPEAPGLAYPHTGPTVTPGADFDPGPRVREELQPDGRVLEVRDANMPTGGIVTTYTDITQHKQIIETLQEAKAAAEGAAAAKAAFLATMSHEIRTPMNGVIGMTNVLLATGLTPDQREIVEVIRQSGESLMVVINDILDYSKFESGQMELEWQPLRLRDVVDHSVRLLSAKAQLKQVPIVVAIAEDIPPVVLGDRNRLQQVLVNLLSNAVKFTKEGQVRISVMNASAGSPHSSGELAGDLCTLTVCVEDSGIGIARDKLDTIFEPFVQADCSTARRFGGTGLGLAIARRLARAMGGEVEIESELGVGTRARFSFVSETAVPRSARVGSAEAPLCGKRALVVSGDRADVGRLVHQLHRWGLSCQLCHSSTEALTQAEDNAFDMVLAAAHFVDRQGLHFVRSLRHRGVTVPVVLLSRACEATSVDPELLAWVVPRNAAQAALHDALVEAVGSSVVSVAADDRFESEFDGALAGRAPLRILVAEDNEVNRRVALRMLLAFGYEADVAHDGAQALEAVLNGAYDLVLMDIQMPNLDGIDATRQIVEALPAHRRPRIIAMSANVMREDVEAALAAGADDYIGKPFPVAHLRAALESTADRAPVCAVRKREAEHPAPQLISSRKVSLFLRGDEEGEFLDGLIRTFSDASHELQNRLSKACEMQDGPTLRALAHEYCGMCAVIGAEQLGELARGLQESGRDARLPGTALLVERCRVAREATIAALRSTLDSHRQAAGGSGAGRHSLVGAEAGAEQ